jgi:hypothetical protein
MAMNAVTDGARDPYARFWEQLAEVRRQNPDTNFLVTPDEATPGSGIPPSYVYEANAVLVHDDDMHRVRRHTRVGDEDSGVSGVRKLRFGNGTHIPTEVDRLNWLCQRAEPGEHSEHGGPVGRPASPNHLFSIAPVNLCPAGEPRPVPPVTPLWPPPHPLHPHPHPGTAGEGISVLVIDTGFQQEFADSQPLLAGVQSVGAARVLQGPTGLIKEYAGHGTFVTGVLRSAAPGTQVWVSSALQAAGAMLEGDLGGHILQALAAVQDQQNVKEEEKRWPHIISLSGGATSHGNCELKGLKPLFDELATNHTDTVLIAAAGNDGSEHKFWPAAGARTHPGVISVGALRRDGRGRACFSNHGDWVTVFAYGENVINLFPDGNYAYQHDSTPGCRYYSPALYPDCGCVTSTHYGDLVAFDGRASWSGTSFATPLVAGMIAAHMTKIGEKSNARLAAQDLLDRHAETIVDAADQEVLQALI